MQGELGDVDLSEKNLSASQVKKHRSCPRSYWFRYVSDLEETKPGSRYLAFGSAVHDAIEAYLLNGALSIEDEWAAYADKEGVPEEMYEDGVEAVQTAVEYIEKRDPDIRDVEHRHEFHISRHDLDTDVTAIMDVETQDEIWDWKTGSIRDDTYIEEQIQGSIYAAAFYDKHGVVPEKIRFIYLSEGKVRSKEPKDEYWQTMLGHARRLEKSKREGYFEADPSSFCYHCGYEYYCEGTSAGVGDIDWEAYLP